MRVHTLTTECTAQLRVCTLYCTASYAHISHHVHSILCTTQVEDRGDVEGVFLFCLVWSVGAALVGSSRDKFDELVKRLAGGSAATPRDSIYAHRYNTSTHK
jgi:Dynein heavy chain AAA lid domain